MKLQYLPPNITIPDSEKQIIKEKNQILKKQNNYESMKNKEQITRFRNFEEEQIELGNKNYTISQKISWLPYIIFILFFLFTMIIQFSQKVSPLLDSNKIHNIGDELLLIDQTQEFCTTFCNGKTGSCTSGKIRTNTWYVLSQGLSNVFISVIFNIHLR